MFTVAVLFLCIAAAGPEVIFVSPCECQGFHGKNRWVTKTDLTPVPSDKSVIQSVTPSQIYAWEGLGPNVEVTRYTKERMPSEQKWCALTGRVVDLKVEADGDIHIALEDATGNAIGTVSAEIPVGPKWCEIRQLFSVGRRIASLSVSRQPKISNFASHMSSRSRAKRFTILPTRPRGDSRLR